jgi:hypothetical protein
LLDTWKASMTPWKAWRKRVGRAPYAGLRRLVHRGTRTRVEARAALEQAEEVGGVIEEIESDCGTQPAVLPRP